MGTIRTPALCALNFDADKGDSVEWKNATTNCIVSQNGTDPFPFSSSNPDEGVSNNINPSPPTPVPTVIVIADGTSAGKAYNYQISCCSQQNPVHTVTVTDTLSRSKRH